MTLPPWQDWLGFGSAIGFANGLVKFGPSWIKEIRLYHKFLRERDTIGKPAKATMKRMKKLAKRAASEGDKAAAESPKRGGKSKKKLTHAMLITKFQPEVRTSNPIANVANPTLSGRR